MDVAVEEKVKCSTKTKAKNEAGFIKDKIGQALEKFNDMIGRSEALEIDAYLEKGDLISGKDFMAEADGFKVINHELECAYFVPIDMVIRASEKELEVIVLSLVDGVFQRVHGVTRIVGYYSRVHNWNKAKIGELRDRRNGNYWENKRANVGKVELLGE